MNSSARRSSSPVVIPGWTSRRAARASRRRPCRARHLSISLRDLRMITVPRPARARCRISAKTSSIGPVRVMGHELPGRAVVLDDGSVSRVVDLEPALDHLGRVVGAALLAGARASARARRRRQVEERSRRARGRCREHRVERLGLRGVAREPVEHEPSRASALGEALPISSTMSSSGTRSPGPGSARRRWPSSGPAAIAARNMSPWRRAGCRTRRRCASPGFPCRPPEAEEQQVHYFRKPS